MGPAFTGDRAADLASRSGGEQRCAPAAEAEEGGYPRGARIFFDCAEREDTICLLTEISRPHKFGYTTPLHQEHAPRHT